MPDTEEGREKQARQAERRRIRRQIEEAMARLDEQRPQIEGEEQDEETEE